MPKWVLIKPKGILSLFGFFYTSLGPFNPNKIRLFPDRVLFGAIWRHFHVTARQNTLAVFRNQALF